jgi:hypothetical protein
MVTKSLLKNLLRTVIPAIVALISWASLLRDLGLPLALPKVVTFADFHWPKHKSR